MTMLDISVHPFINYWSKDEEKVTIELSVFDEMFTVTVNKKEQKLYEDAAHFITKRYSWYYKTYEKVKSEPEISRSQGWLWWISALRNSIHPLLMTHQRKRAKNLTHLLFMDVFLQIPILILIFAH